MSLTFQNLDINCFIFLVPPIVDKPTEVKIASFEEDIELYCSVSSGNPHPNIIWLEQPDSCATDNCKPLESDWKMVTKVTWIKKRHL